MLSVEAAIPSVEDLAKEEVAKLQEHLIRLPAKAPGCRVCESVMCVTTGWLPEAEKLVDRLQLSDLLREPLQLKAPFAPWEQPMPKVIHTVAGCH